MSTQDKTMHPRLKTLDDRLRRQGSRIDVLKQRSMPGGAGSTGYGAQLAAARLRLRRSNAEFFRLVRVPTERDDWEDLHDSLEMAVDELEKRVEHLER